MDGCIYRTKDGECDLYAEGGKYKAFCDMDGCKGRKMSNADKLRAMTAMTDEELAAFLEAETGDSVPTDWLDWLKQEVSDT